MPIIPDTYIDDLLQRLDIVELIDGYVPLKRAGANFMACCPFHNEKTPSFTVSPTKQFYHCFGCGAHGSAIGFLMQYAGESFVDAVTDLSARLGMKIPQNIPHAAPSFESKEKRRSLTEVMETAAAFFYEEMKKSPRAMAYLKNRGLSGEVVKHFRIGYAPDGWQPLKAAFPHYEQMHELQEAGLVIRNDSGRVYDRFRDRIMFPIINPKGEVIAFGGRVLDQGEPKYLNSPETPLFEKGREVFGLPQARVALRAHNTVLVVEGYMDVVALACHGISNAVATLGTATTPTHIQKLLRQADRLIFCFDGDEAGKKAAWRALENALEHASEHKAMGFVFLAKEDDPDSFVRDKGKDAFERLILQAMPLSEFLMTELSKRSDLATAEGRAAFVADAKPRLLKIASPLLRLQLVKRIAEMTGFSQQEVERLCDLKAFAKKAPPRVPRQPPSLLRHLAKLLLAKPALAKEVPKEALPDNEEGRALLALMDALSNVGDKKASFASVIERFSTSAYASFLPSLLEDHLQIPEAEEDTDETFTSILSRLTENTHKATFLKLQEKVKQLGLTHLSSEEKEEYVKALSKTRRMG